MTSIVAVETKNSIILGADSQATGYRKISLKDKKIFSNGDYTFGVAGDARVLHVFVDADLPEAPNDGLEYFMKTDFRQALLGAASAGGVDGSWSCIVVIHGQVFLFEGSEIGFLDSSGITTIGSGSPWIEGSLYGQNRITRRHVERALLSASRNDPYTAPPFHVVELPKGR